MNIKTRDMSLKLVSYAELMLSWSGYSGLTNTQKRRAIKKKLDSKHFLVNISKLDTSTIENDATGRAVSDGVVLIKAYYDGTDDTGEIISGQPVVFDTVTGKSVTGINSTWGVDEYTVVGTALKNFNRAAPYEGDEEDRNLVPVRLINNEMLYDMVCYVDSSGIPGRDGDTIYGKRCVVCSIGDDISTDPDVGERVLSNTSVTTMVYNVNKDEVTGPKKVVTSILRDPIYKSLRIRYVVVEDCETESVY